jgi:hypothetical protein
MPIFFSKEEFITEVFKDPRTASVVSDRAKMEAAYDTLVNFLERSMFPLIPAKPLLRDKTEPRVMHAETPQQVEEPMNFNLAIKRAAECLEEAKKLLGARVEAASGTNQVRVRSKAERLRSLARDWMDLANLLKPDPAWTTLSVAGSKATLNE